MLWSIYIQTTVNCLTGKCTNNRSHLELRFIWDKNWNMPQTDCI